MTDQPAPTYLPPGLPIPVPEPDGLSAPYWEGLRQNRLLSNVVTAARRGNSVRSGFAIIATHSIRIGLRCRPRA